MPDTATRAKANAASTGGKSKKSGGNPKTKPKRNPNPKKRQSAKAKPSGAGEPPPPNSSAPAGRKQKSPPPRPEPASDPPLECARSDFEALLGDAAGLADRADASAELLDCARHGEVDACRAILDVWSDGRDGPPPGDEDARGTATNATIADAADASGSTPLHKACANGHASTVRLLLSRGARHLRNGSGNTPLHWAAGAGHEGCVRMLLDHYDAVGRTDGGGSEAGRAVDVLLKNDFGRSALTEGFASGDTKTVEHLLNHDSAEEDKLIGGLDKKEVEDAKEANDVAEGGRKDDKKEVEKKSIVHEFDFSSGDCENEVGSGDRDCPTVLIRELVSTFHSVSERTFRCHDNQHVCFFIGQGFDCWDDC